MPSCSELSFLAELSPAIIPSNSPRSMVPLPSSSRIEINFSICEGGRSAKLRANRPSRNSSELISPSSFTSNLENRLETDNPVALSQFDNTSTTLSAIKETPQCGQEGESSGANPSQAPHAPRASSETP